MRRIGVEPEGRIVHDLIRIPREILRNNSGIDRMTYLARGIFWAISKRLRLAFTTRLWNGARIPVMPNGAYSSIFYYKYPEGKDTEFLRLNADMGDVLVDVGANVGIFSALMADKFRRIVMFEPSPDSFAAAREMARLNSEMAVFELHQVAVSDKAGPVRFLREGQYSSVNRVAGEAVQDSANIEHVEADTLDRMIGDRFDRVVLKIDIEGGEERAFRGARRLLATRRVKLVMFERLGRTNLANVESCLVSQGYRLFRIMEGGSLSTREEDIRVPLINLFACPAEEFGRLKLLEPR